MRSRYISYRIKYFKNQIKDLVFFANLSLGEIGQEYEITKIFQKNLTEYEIEFTDLHVGDVILSYKTKKYLESAFLSWLISITQKSQITHSSIVSRVEGNHIEHINPTPDHHHVIVSEALCNKENEILFIMRPKIPRHTYIQLRKELDILRRDIEDKKVIYTFAEYKQWYAAFEGLIYSNFISFFRRIILFKNIFREKNAFYCSEFIDYIFKKIGIYLVPRSEYDSMLGPSELLYSPFLELVGIIYNKNEIEFVRAEEVMV